ncbi:dormancy-associated protein homolog 3-like isoform X2 [Lotus japonicus]|uniref:dormancy-associated protein homolog 3-like isoform X2 n=1 Tax=Lotus japonicus TaxID=34305 RepID=UPI0025878A0D|nr:dormancy-associated protein homolog 3-like isoform X2 [Lotus japonicus]
MGLLDQLWDDTVAGPRPENGLGKLRKHHTFASRSISGKESEAGSVRSYGEESPAEVTTTTRVTRSIMIVKPPGYQINGSPPASPAGSTTPGSPFSGAREPFRFRRRSASDAYEERGQNRSSPPSPFDV